jgi:hypothetical protein
MNETEWMACTEPWEMLSFLEPRASNRKLQLFAVACCRRAWAFGTDPRQRELVEAAERFADGLLSQVEFDGIRDAVIELSASYPDEAPWGPSRYMTAATLHARGGGAAKHAARFAARGLAGLAGEENSPGWLAALQAEVTAQCAVLRDIYGPPFRPFRFDPVWLSGEGLPASELANEIEAGGRYEDLSSLADELERSRCNNRVVLDHCREPGTHVHGCWVLDALLGRECAVREGLTTEAAWQACGDPAPMLHFLRDKGTARRWRLFAVACCRRIDHLITDERSRQAVAVAARYAEGAAGGEELEIARAVAQEARDEAMRAEYKAEAEEDFCMTPRYAAFGLRLFAAEAARSAVSRDPCKTDAEPGSFDAEYWRPSHEWAVAALHDQIFAGMSTHDHDGWQSEAVKASVKLIELAERRAHCEILRDLFGEYLGPPGDKSAWLPGGESLQESWCVLPSPVSFDSGREWMTWNGGFIPKLARAIYERERFDSLSNLADALEEAGCTDPTILNHLRDSGPHLRGCWVLDLLMGRGFPQLA